MKMMSQILNKLLSIAISDPDDDVREIMLGSFKQELQQLFTTQIKSPKSNPGSQ
jgi:hypothetical protein